MSMEPATTQASNCIKCSVQLVPDAIYCHRCGTKQPAPTLILHLDEETTFVVSQLERTYTIGRTIEALEHYVDIDLGAHGGKEQGVSRLHAEIMFDDTEYQWNLKDAGSQFGTFIGEEQLEADVKHPLSGGQEIRCGGISLTVEIKTS